MLNKSSEYTARIEEEEHQMIRACVLMSARQAEEKETQARAVEIINTLADALSNLNHGRMTTVDADIICASLEAMIRLMRHDRTLPVDQREGAMGQARTIQQKLTRGNGSYAYGA